MKTNAKLFFATLHKVLPLCKGRTTLPILTCVKLQAKDGNLTVIATDLNAFVCASCQCEGDLEAVCVDALALHYLLSIAEGDVSIELENKRLLIEGAGTAHLCVLEASDFPNWPNYEGVSLGINATDLATCIQAVAWAAETKDKFNPDVWKECVSVVTYTKGIECCGTNSKEFAHVNLPAIAANSTFLFPSEQADLLCSGLMIAGAVISVNKSWINVLTPAYEVAIKLAEDTHYPNLKRLLDAPCEPLGTLDTLRLLQCFETIKAMNYSEPFIGCTLHLSPGKVGVKFSGKSGSFSRSVEAADNKVAKSIRLDAMRAIKVFKKPSITAKAFVNGGAILFRDGDYTYALALMKDEK